MEHHDKWKAELERLCYIDGDAIVFDAHGSQYDILLTQCASYREILKWVTHLSRKSWMRLDVLHRFVYLACDYHGLEL
jgi:hypothetical protein